MRLTVLSLAKVIKGHSWWKCKCVCGVVVSIRGSRLIAGTTKSCGCLRVIHGDSRSTTHNIWWAMQQRCHNPKNNRWVYYGARGIKVCDRWKGTNGYQNFITDVGLRPDKHYSIDRINNDGNYEPGNVKWSTRVEQAKNQRKGNQWKSIARVGLSSL